MSLSSIIAFNGILVLASVHTTYGQYHHSIWHDKFTAKEAKRTRVLSETQIHKSINLFTKTAMSNHVLTDVHIKKRPASANYGDYNSIKKRNRHLVKMKVRTSKNARVRLNRYQKPKTR